MAYKKVTHVIFDLDGLLLATEKIYENAIQEVVSEFGKQYTKDVRMKVIGTIEPDTARIVITELELPLSAEEFHNRYFKLAEIGLAKAELFPGAERLLRHLAAHKVPIAMATSSSKKSCELKGQSHKELFSLFHHKVMASSDPEVKRGKPCPDIFLICAARFEDDVKPEDCLVFEDAPNGVKAARSAGMQVVMVPDPETDPDLCTPATLVLNSLEDFKPELFGLPPF